MISEIRKPVTIWILKLLSATMPLPCYLCYLRGARTWGWPADRGGVRGADRAVAGLPASSAIMRYMSRCLASCPIISCATSVMNYYGMACELCSMV